MYKVCFLSHNVPAVKQKSILISHAIAEITAGANDDNLLLGKNGSRQNTSSAVTMLQFKPILFFFGSNEVFTRGKGILFAEGQGTLLNPVPFSYHQCHGELEKVRSSSTIYLNSL